MHSKELHTKKMLLLFLFLGIVISTDQDTKGLKGKVIELNSGNIKSFIQKNKKALLLFYTTTSSPSVELKKEYDILAQKLASSKLYTILGSVDCIQKPNLAKEYQITEFPTLLLKTSKSLEKVDYFTSADSLYTFLLNLEHPEMLELQKFDDLEEVLQEGKSLFLLTSEKEKEIKLLKELIPYFPRVKFAFSTDEHFLDGENRFAFFKDKEEEPKFYKGKINKKNLKKFLKENDIPTIIEFEGLEAVDKFLTDLKPAVVIFSDVKDAEFEIFEKSAEELNSEIIFVWSKINSGLGGRLVQFLGITPIKNSVWILVPSKAGISKYRYTEAQLTQETLIEFVEDFQSGKLEKDLRSDPTPTDNKGLVKTIVGSTFKNLALESEKNVLVLFHAPWCEHCDNLNPIFEELAQRMKHEVLFAKFNVSGNEIENLEYEVLPYLRFYIGNREDQYVEYLDEDRSLDALQSWLNFQIKKKRKKYQKTRTTQN